MNHVFAVLALAAGLTGCGTTPDERPVTFEVVTLSVLAPTCGQVQCHSTSTHTQGYAFDTLGASRESLRGTDDRKKIWEQIDGGEMPPDAPMADEDKELVKAWLDAGAPGL